MLQRDYGFLREDMGLGKLLDPHGSLREFEVNNRFNLTLNLCSCIKCSLLCIVAWIDLYGQQ